MIPAAVFVLQKVRENAAFALAKQFNGDRLGPAAFFGS